MLPQKMKLQGTAQAWRRAAEKGETWNEEKEDDDEAWTMPLNDILCPACGAAHKTRDMRLKVKTGFSSATCKNKECGKVTISSAWTCRCRRQWVKCPMHVHEALQKNKKI